MIHQDMAIFRCDLKDGEICARFDAVGEGYAAPDDGAEYAGITI